MRVQRIILTANRLPATLAQTSRGSVWHTSPGGMAAALTPVRKKWDATWIGWSGSHKAIDKPFPPGLQGLHIDTETYSRYYNAVANGALWPGLHGLTPQPFSKTDWLAYQQVNKQFALAIAAAAKPGDLIWIHDFHLLLVPNMLRQLGVNNRIGVFLHVPFAGANHLPSAYTKALLEGFLHADLCGVQTNRDAKQLAIDIKKNFPGKVLPRVQAFPIGIDYGHYQRAHRLMPVQRRIARIQQATSQKYVVLSVSRLDYTKGIITQLRALEHAAKNGLQDVHYKLIVAPSRETIGAYQTLKKAIDREVARIQEDLPGVVDYQYRNADFSELCAWYIRADALLVTPLIDGMNLVAKEYIATKPKNQYGTIILSSKAGAAEQLKDALLVDPKDESAISAALLQAQAMPIAERRSRTHAIRQNIQSQDVFWWAQNFVETLANTPNPIE